MHAWSYTIGIYISVLICVYASVVYQSYISFMCTHLSYTGFMCTHLSYTSRISVLFVRICHKYQFYVYASVVYQSYTNLMCVHLSFTSLYQLYLYLEKYRYYQTGIIKYMYIYIKYYYEVGDKVRRGERRHKVYNCITLKHHQIHVQCSYKAWHENMHDVIIFICGWNFLTQITNDVICILDHTGFFLYMTIHVFGQWWSV